jgi:DNA-binding NtrC family response regulator
MFASSLGLVISGSHLAGISGPEFVAELRARMPYLPVMVLGSGKDTPADYLSDHVRFLPVPVESDEMLRQASQMLALHKASAA